jgi:hypothetical protein
VAGIGEIRNIDHIVITKYEGKKLLGISTLNREDIKMFVLKRYAFGVGWVLVA